MAIELLPAVFLFLAISALIGLTVRYLLLWTYNVVRKLIWLMREGTPSPPRSKRIGMVGWLGWSLMGGIILLILPNMITYGRPGPVAQAVSMAEGIRAAMASFAADSADHGYPHADQIRDYTALRILVNRNGGTLPESEAKARVRFVSYATQDTYNDGVPDRYLLILMAIDTNGKPVAQLRVTPEGTVRVPEQGVTR